MFQPLFKSFQSKADYKPVDLSKSSLNGLNVNPQDNTGLSTYLNQIKIEKQAKVLYGGYLEERSLYNKKPLFNTAHKQRNIHLGVDFWIDAGEGIFCPVDGEIHSFADNRGVGNYGPCIILKHEKNNQNFYTLYGHLKRDSLLNIEVGEFITQNQVFCQLGNTEENGGYVPHLHFQIIKDIQDYTGDYPGVCHKIHLEYYKNNTVNPVDFLDLLI